MDWDNITELAIAVIGLAGLVYQTYCSHTNKEHTEKTVGTTNEELLKVKNELNSRLDTIEDKEEALHSCMAVNNRVTIANARSAIKRFHDMHKGEKKITYSDLEMLEEIYSAYKNMRFEDGHVPNGYADRCMDDIRKWEVMEDGFTYANDIIVEDLK